MSGGKIGGLGANLHVGVLIFTHGDRGFHSYGCCNPVRKEERSGLTDIEREEPGAVVTFYTRKKLFEGENFRIKDDGKLEWA